MSVSLEIDKRPEIGDGRIIITTDSVIDESPFYMNNHRKRRTITFYVDKESMPELESQLKARYGSKPNESDERFKEPTEKGCYATQSGQILFNDGDESIRWTLMDGEENWSDWPEILNQLDESEFPLTKLTNELVKKAVEQ